MKQFIPLVIILIIFFFGFKYQSYFEYFGWIIKYFAILVAFCAIVIPKYTEFIPEYITYSNLKSINKLNDNKNYGIELKYAEKKIILKNQNNECIFCKKDIEQNYILKYNVPLDRSGFKNLSNFYAVCYFCSIKNT